MSLFGCKSKNTINKLNPIDNFTPIGNVKISTEEGGTFSSSNNVMVLTQEGREYFDREDVDSVKLEICKERGHVKPENLSGQISFSYVSPELIDTETSSIMIYRVQANFKCQRCGEWVHIIEITKKDTLWSK